MNIWVNGCFDILHLGHIELLKYASTFGKVRVGIDSDKRVKQLKGSHRPINSQEMRMKFLESIKWVDSVVVFNSDEELIDSIKNWNTDIIIIGSDYKDKKVIGSEVVNQVLFFDKIEGLSTTKLINYLWLN